MKHVLMEPYLILKRMSVIKNLSSVSIHSMMKKVTQSDAVNVILLHSPHQTLDVFLTVQQRTWSPSIILVHWFAQNIKDLMRLTKIHVSIVN